MSSYNPNIPQPTDKLKNSQPQIRDNFSSANTSFGVNHFSFDNVTVDNGKHNFVELVERLVIPPGLVNGEETLYSKVVSGQGQLFFTRGSSGVQIQMTGPGDPVALANGKTFVPGGILLQWGTATAVTDGPVSFSTAFPSNCFGIICTVFESNNNRHFVFTKTKSLSGFTVASRDSSGNDESNTFFWIAVGN